MSALPNLAAGDCFHCGLPVPAGSNWTVRIESIDQPMCCPGCQAVAQTIVELGIEVGDMKTTGNLQDALRIAFDRAGVEQTIGAK